MPLLKKMLGSQKTNHLKPLRASILITSCQYKCMQVPDLRPLWVPSCQPSSCQQQRKSDGVPSREKNKLLEAWGQDLSSSPGRHPGHLWHPFYLASNIFCSHCYFSLVGAWNLQCLAFPLSSLGCRFLCWFSCRFLCWFPCCAKWATGFQKVLFRNYGVCSLRDLLSDHTVGGQSWVAFSRG